MKPGGDPSRIVIEYEGLDAPLAVHANGRLLLKTSLGEIYEKPPFAYQIIGRRQIEVPARFELLSSTRYGVRCDGYDFSKELVIDPLVYSTFFGGGGDEGIWATTLDGPGNIFVTGWTNSEYTFPITPGAYNDTSDCRGFLTKFNPAGDSLIFSTFTGGWHSYPRSIALAEDGSIWVVGSCENCAHVPLTADAFDTVAAGPSEGFLSAFSSTGSHLLFSTFLGGGG